MNTNRGKPKSAEHRAKISAALKGKPRPAVAGEKNPMFGKSGALAPGYKGGRRMMLGYVYLLVQPDHPFFSMAIHQNPSYYIAEHRLVMAEHLGRPLTSQEEVHHKNEVRDDNRLENLELMSKGDHGRLHKKGKPRPVRRNA